jgi:hypothetical protein
MAGAGVFFVQGWLMDGGKTDDLFSTLSYVISDKQRGESLNLSFQKRIIMQTTRGIP